MIVNGSEVETMKLYDRRYVCTGANFRNGFTTAMCGDVHSLGEWLDILFPNKDARSFFEGDTEKDILEYLHTNTGKRLERRK